MLDGETPVFRRLVVVLDDFAPWQGAFAHALDWAWRLRLPIQALYPPWMGYSKIGNRQPSGPCNGATLATDETTWLRSCAHASAELGVVCELSKWEGNALTGLRRSLAANDICIISNSLPLAHKRFLLRQTPGSPSPAILICAESHASLSRILLLCSGNPNRFLLKAVHVCRELRARPVVLSVASSERAAQRHQQAAREALARYEQNCDFDFLVGSDVRAAVTSVARWRGCQLVVVEQHTDPAWLRWLRGNPLEQLIGFIGSVSFLALPEADSGVPVSEPNLLRTALTGP